ncbi:hypothetical protein GCM10010435_40440 [Winogradskya consettensis]|uniref:Uncharacterized protein n=1 Tax=Winogradskya consettensis TaxID=113560 RepID=A0A919SDJ8_9ACTN|nr:hypothetical protein [Actinoplanes consettensis]GIM69707.1 hypothetical protein Aco04nite_16570 [Actinoplanes consettensis]
MRLHEVVETVTADEPPLGRSIEIDEIVSAGRRAERRRKGGFAMAGAAALVAVVAGGAFALPAHDDTTTATTAVGTAGPTAVTSPPFSFTFGAYDAGRLHVQNPTDVSAAYQVATITVDGAPSGAYASLTVYQPGAFNEASLTNATTVTVDGQAVLQATLLADGKPRTDADRGDKAIAWQYATGAWAVVKSLSTDADNPSFTDLTALIAGFKPNTSPAPAVLPFTMAYLPAGYTAVDVAEHSLPGWDSITGSNGTVYGGAIFARNAPATGLSDPYLDLPGSFTITVSSLAATGQKPPPIDASHKCTNADAATSCTYSIVTGTTLLSVTGNLPIAEKTQVAKSIKLADLTDETTWTPATKLLHP